MLQRHDAPDGETRRQALMLFVRPGELRGAQWPEFQLDGDAPAWRYFVRVMATPSTSAH